MEKNGRKWEIGCILILLINSLGLFGQVGLQYLPCQTCPVNTPAQNFKILSITDDVISDFGRRNSPGNTLWHRGIDLTVAGVNDEGYHLISPVNGTITTLFVLDPGYKYIVVDGPGNQDFGFGHIFNDALLPIKVGDLVLKQCNNSNAFAIINLTTNRAIGPVNGAIVTYLGNNYVVSNHVSSGDVLAPLGTSGYNASHVHLYHPANPLVDPQSIANAKDPMEILTHYSTTYVNNIFHFYNVAQAPLNINFPGNVYASVAVECNMQNPGLLGNPPNQYYHTSIMDVDREELFIRPANKPNENYTLWGNSTSNYQLIKGPNYSSYISNGSRFNSVAYPSSVTGPSHGSESFTGVYPHAYNDNPMDIYFFSDIVTRIHKNHNVGQTLQLANISDDARYPDGDYSLFLRTTRVTGVQSAISGSVNNVIRIDNFRPYIKKVSVKKNDLSNPFYIAEWGWNGSSLVFNPLQNTSTSLGNDLVVNITTSEPMTDLRLSIGTWTIMVNTPVNPGDAVDWQILVPSTALIPGLNVLRFSGHDKAGNILEGFVNTQSKPAGSFPVRTSETTWSPYPYEYEDIVHKINIVDNGPLIADFFPLDITINPGEYVSFFDQSSGGNILAWHWAFDGGTPATSITQDPVIQFNTVGVHTVSLSVNNISSTSVKTGTVTVTAEQLPPVADFIPLNVTISQYETVHFMDISSGNPTQWYWDFDGADQPSILQNPEVYFDQTGTYTISLTVLNDAGIDEVSGTITVVDEPEILDVMCSVNPFMASPGTVVNFQGSVFNGVPPYIYTFDFGDGTMIPVTSSSLSESVSHSYLNSGSYYLMVGIIDAVNQMTFCNEYVTIMGGNPCENLSPDFSISPGGGNFSAPVNSTVTFTDLTGGGTQPYLYNWVFSPDPLTGHVPSASSFTGPGPHTVTYSFPGNYPVSLHISDFNGCGKTIERSITVFSPQHCLVAKINKMINGKMVVPLGITNFWDLTFVPWCGLCQDPPGTSNFPCETNNYWRLVRQPMSLFVAQQFGYPFQAEGCVLNSSVDQLFQYQFVDKGWYKLSLRAWDVDCNVVSGYDCIDETSLKIHVIDCNGHEEICNSNFVIQQGYNEDVFTGILTAGGPNCPMIIPSDADIDFLATQEIKLEDGFESRQGSEFLAKIEECPNSENTPVRIGPEENPSVFGKVKWDVYPNPVSDFVAVRFSEDQSAGYKLEVYNLLGDCKIRKDDLISNIETLDFTLLPPGIYLIHYKGISGDLSMKIIRK